jgi:curved DNA-binding protein CbpA
MASTEFHLTELKQAYQLLGVPLSASGHLIKQAYRRLVKRWHPDRYPSGTTAHSEATQMSKLINEAYSNIERAPLRYHIEASPPARRTTAQVMRTSTDESTSQTDEKFPNTSRLEFWVRFVCGALFGAIVSLDLLLNFSEFSAGVVFSMVSLILGFAIASARFGDKFWYSILRRWWLWP